MDILELMRTRYTTKLTLFDKYSTVEVLRHRHAQDERKNHAGSQGLQHRTHASPSADYLHSSNLL